MPKARKRKWAKKGKPSTMRLRRLRGTNRPNVSSQQAASLRNSREAFSQFHEGLIETTQKGLANCLETHVRDCPRHPFDSTGFLPTRLLDLNDLDRPRLVASTDIDGQDIRYVCLSHEWGNPSGEEKLTMSTVTNNLQSRLQGTDLSTLPTRYQEAIMICQLIGVQYIWIDSLCIIQVCS